MSWIRRFALYVVEGEGDVHAAEGAFVIATTPGGVGRGKWKDEYSERLRGASRAVVVADRGRPRTSTR